MTRANRVYVPGHVWHLTHRCHQKDFLLGHREDRRRWVYWLYQARRRYGICVLNYIVTRNHIHLLVRDRGEREIAASMQLVAGRTAQAYNQRMGRVGAFWQDRYHATAVESDGHLVRCMSYIDLNMVRAGAVAHPSEWPESGFREIQRGKSRYRIIDIPAVCRLTGASSPRHLRDRLRRWTEHQLAAGRLRREPAWTESLAVGPGEFLRRVHRELGGPSRDRELIHADGLTCLREPSVPYVLDRPPYVTQKSLNCVT
ncbi:transposase [Thioalkalivibrio sp. XN8]|uniref:transposase n=1 Tax=Thioalkalivibrio sp. XN8 TaxID=2712863 RepID=UPI001F0D0D80|nr:transposase [Thioalkalivibrio sp. XN8]